MKIMCIGDSLTKGDYGIKGGRGVSNVKEKNYPYFLSEILGCETVNCGKCGCTPVGYLTYYDEGNCDVTGCDICIVILGTNGKLDPDIETDGDRDMRALLGRIKRDNPDIKIVLGTPPHCTENPEYSNCGYKEKVEKAVAFVRKLAFEQNLPLIDLAECPYFTAETESVMQPNDGLHFGEEGYRHMAMFIADGLKKIFPDKF